MGWKRSGTDREFAAYPSGIRIPGGKLFAMGNLLGSVQELKCDWTTIELTTVGAPFDFGAEKRHSEAWQRVLTTILSVAERRKFTIAFGEHPFLGPLKRLGRNA